MGGWAAAIALALPFAILLVGGIIIGVLDLLDIFDGRGNHR